MNKTAIKKFAIDARNKLRESVSDKIGMLGITSDECREPITKGNDFEVYKTVAETEVTLNKEQCNQRRELVNQIKSKGYDEIVEEVAYTWFNRICAIRFMEVNDYLPTRVRVLSSEKKGKNEPDIVTNAPDIDLDFTLEEKEYIVKAKMDNRLDELFRMLFIKQCNALHEILPELFEATADYTEMLLNISYTNEDDVVRMLVDNVDEDDFNVDKSGQVEIIGWLYQYYNEERKNEVINIYKGTVKKEDIPAATQLFTTDWVVRYMVDNSLGRYWIERNKDSKLQEKLEFFVTPKDGEIIYVDEKISPTELTFIDPCMGSGHILVYAFDVLMEIYRECGYSDRDAALSIVQNNLYGLDIDNRAYQLAYFAVMMKARSYNRRALTQGISNNLCAIQESNGIDLFECEDLTNNKEYNEIGQYLLDVFKDAKELGSIVNVENKDYKGFVEYLLSINTNGQLNFGASIWFKKVQPLCKNLVKQADILSKKYCTVATNPPYLGKMQGQLKKFVTENYKEYSGDLFSVFMYRNFGLCKEYGYSAFMTPFVWMFIKTYEKLRNYIINQKSITTLVQMEYSAFEEATVPICSFVLGNSNENKIGTYFRLSDFKGGMEVQKKKVLEGLNNKECGYVFDTVIDNFNKIPGSPLAYWVSEKMREQFKQKSLSFYADTRRGLQTGNASLFIRKWYEVDKNKISLNLNKRINNNYKWFLFNSGGTFRRWYGNIIDVVNWENNGYDIKNSGKAIIPSENRYFDEIISWNKISSGKMSVRYQPYGIIPGDASPFLHSLSGNRMILMYAMALMNTKVAAEIVEVLSPTINFEVGNIAKIPLSFSDEIMEIILDIVSKCINITQEEWDLYEISWGFKCHPLVKKNICTIEKAFAEWKDKCHNYFLQLKEYEEELNRIFIDIYGLQDELTPEVEDKDVSVRLADLGRDIRSLLSYAVGCMFGRYSLDEEGLIYAGGEWDVSKYSTFIPDVDNVIPITDEEYFEDDIVGLLCSWLKKVYGEDTLEDNLDFIADALGNKGDTSREVIRNYFLKDFIKDHIKVYQKRPIYWLFDSGKENGFKALIYLHRYNADTVGRVRTDYLHKTQKAIEQALVRAEFTRDNANSGTEKSRATKNITKYNKQLAEIRQYDEAIAYIANKRIELDLDDGVKINYAKFQGVVVKQEGKKEQKIDLLAKI